MEFLNTSRIEVESSTRGELEFISNINLEYNSFRVRFYPMIKQISSEIVRNTNPEGKFFTLLFEIKEIQ
ncbi:hypothetical protein LCGC14_1945300 [marine sediment metagenome]|uniref:Uncharacterized protein n=1 Tax=marine sediment metagenome TaxID=412755 RepID=A0A0F9G7E1_9ZZZZ